MGCPLKWEAYVDESSDDLYCVVVLGMIEKVALAALVGRMPVKDVELRRRRLVLR